MAERQYGMASADQIAGLSGLEVLQAMIENRVPAPAMAKTLGFRLVEVGTGTAVFEGEPGSHLLNPLASVHGGWALTIIARSAGCAVHTLLTAGIRYTTVAPKGNFPSPRRTDAGHVPYT